MSLKTRLTDDMKAAMKGGDKASLGVIRLVNAAIKQRKDSVTQYVAADREDLADIERAEIVVIERYLPEKLGEAEVAAAIEAAVAETGASSPSDMGKLMAVLKPRLAGQADMGEVSKLVKQRLS